MISYVGNTMLLSHLQSSVRDCLENAMGHSRQALLYVWHRCSLHGAVAGNDWCLERATSDLLCNGFWDSFHVDRSG